MTKLNELKALTEELKQKEDELCKSELRYKTLVESINDALYSLDAKGNFTYISPVIEKFTSYKTEDFIGKNIVEFVHSDSIELLAYMLPLSKKNQSETFHFQMIDKHCEKVLYVRMTENPVYDSCNVVVGITGVISNITEQVMLQKRLARRYSLFEAVSKSMGVMLWIKDITGQYLFASKLLCEKLLHCTPEEAIGKTDKELISKYETPSPDIHGDIYGITDRIVMTEQKPCRFYEVIRQDGKEIWLEVRKDVLHDITGGNLVGILGWGCEITQEKDDILERIDIRIQRSLVKEIIPNRIYQLERV